MERNKIQGLMITVGGSLNNKNKLTFKYLETVTVI